MDIERLLKIRDSLSLEQYLITTLKPKLNTLKVAGSSFVNTKEKLTKEELTTTSFTRSVNCYLYKDGLLIYSAVSFNAMAILLGISADTLFVNKRKGTKMFGLFNVSTETPSSDTVVELLDISTIKERIRKQKEEFVPKNVNSQQTIVENTITGETFVVDSMAKASQLTKDKEPTRPVSKSSIRTAIANGKTVKGWKFSTTKPSTI